MVDPRKILTWFVNGRTGLSSKTMAATAAGIPVVEVNHPHDPDDFNRCLLLLDYAPEIRGEFPEIAKLSPVWAALIENWHEIEKRFLREAGRDWSKARSAQRTYYFMREIIEAAEQKEVA